MSIVKRGNCSSKVVVSESVYNCPDCGHVEMSDHIEEEKMCPECNILMVLMSSSSHIDEEKEVENQSIEEKDEE
jgi:hypothetical protein